MAPLVQSPGTCPCLPPYIGLEIPNGPPTIAALKITWKPLCKFTKIVLKRNTVTFAPMSKKLWSAIWIAAIYSMVLPGSSVQTAAIGAPLTLDNKFYLSLVIG